MYHDFEILGPYNSGTNALGNFIIQNYNVTFFKGVKKSGNVGNWKHTLRPDIKTDKLYILLIKEPMFWLKSCAKAPYHGLLMGRDARMKSFNKPVKIPGKTFPHDYMPPKVFSNGIELWNAYNNLYDHLNETYPNTIRISYREFLYHPEKIIKRLDQYLERKSGEMRIDNSRSKSHGNSRTRTDALKSYTPEELTMLYTKHRRIAQKIYTLKTELMIKDML